MKTPDEIKKGLDCCQTIVRCSICSYHDIGDIVAECTAQLSGDALVYIQQLESRLAGACGVCAYNFTGDKSCLAHIKQLESRLAQVERERDAAVNDLNFVKSCWVCENKRNIKGEPCNSCDLAWRNHFEWRGVCEENAKEEMKE